MQPVKITIPGNFIDCQIYRGRLYLWTLEADLVVYDWTKLVQSFADFKAHERSLTYAFLDGHVLYSDEMLKLFSDKDFKSLLQGKFETLSGKDYQLEEKKLKRVIYGKDNSPGKEIPTDTEIFGNTLYYVNDTGLFCSTAHKGKKHPVSTKPAKLWDGIPYSIKANNFPQLALSCGDEGLYELRLYSKVWERKGIQPRKIGSGHSSFANYTFLSVYNSSVVEKSYMALFEWRENKEATSRKDKYVREQSTLFNEKDIFNTVRNNNYLSWGTDDKIYRAGDSGFEVVRFNNYAKKERHEDFFSKAHRVPLDAWKGRVISGGTAYFGTIVECENALVVIMSDKNTFTIPGPITQWRVYPRSLNYENHLHVIKDDCVEIYSFNHDYFIDQQEKDLGIKYVSREKGQWKKKYSGL